MGSGSILNSNEFNIPFYFRDNITLFPFTAPTYTLSSLLPALVVPSPSAPTGDQRYLAPNDRQPILANMELQRAKGAQQFL